MPRARGSSSSSTHATPCTRLRRFLAKCSFFKHRFAPPQQRFSTGIKSTIFCTDSIDRESENITPTKRPAASWWGILLYSAFHNAPWRRLLGACPASEWKALAAVAHSSYKSTRKWQAGNQDPPDCPINADCKLRDIFIAPQILGETRWGQPAKCAPVSVVFRQPTPLLRADIGETIRAKGELSYAHSRTANPPQNANKSFASSAECSAEKREKTTNEEDQDLVSRGVQVFVVCLPCHRGTTTLARKRSTCVADPPLIVVLPDRGMAAGRHVCSPVLSASQKRQGVLETACLQEDDLQSAAPAQKFRQKPGSSFVGASVATCLLNLRFVTSMSLLLLQRRGAGCLLFYTKPGARLLVAAKG